MRIFTAEKWDMMSPNIAGLSQIVPSMRQSDLMHALVTQRFNSHIPYMFLQALRENVDDLYRLNNVFSGASTKINNQVTVLSLKVTLLQPLASDVR